jgi:hypothetical protein
MRFPLISVKALSTNWLHLRAKQTSNKWLQKFDKREIKLNNTYNQDQKLMYKKVRMLPLGATYMQILMKLI